MIQQGVRPHSSLPHSLSSMYSGDLSGDYDVQGIDAHMVAHAAVIPFEVKMVISSTCHATVINALQGC